MVGKSHINGDFLASHIGPNGNLTGVSHGSFYHFIRQVDEPLAARCCDVRCRHEEPTESQAVAKRSGHVAGVERMGATEVITRPGKRLHFANLNMAIEIVDLPIEHGDLP